MMRAAAAVWLALASVPCAAQESTSLRGSDHAADKPAALEAVAGAGPLTNSSGAAAAAGAGPLANVSAEMPLLGSSSGSGDAWRHRCAATFQSPFWPNANNNCLWQSCCDPSMTCHVKQPGLFGGCMRSCTPGIHYNEPIFFWYSWSCAVSGAPAQPTFPTMPTMPTLPPPAPTPAPAPAPIGPSNAETFAFYMYRSQSNATYAPKNVNTANLGGVMWYLTHEVMVKSPPKFGVTHVLRYKVQTKAPQRLVDAGMNFGVRYAYDSQECTGPGECPPQYTKWGYFVGCNNLGDFPYPKFNTYFPKGVWYSLPGNGECEGPPTGDFSCTYSFEAAGEASLAEITSAANSSGVKDVWGMVNSTSANKAKVALLQSVFSQKYPESADLPDPPCDFDYGAFYPGGGP